MRGQFVVLAVLACGGVGPGGTGGGSNGGAGGGSTGGGGALGADTATQALSGTRLKVRYLQADDGARVFVGFHDTLRNEDCSFATASDGQQRCLPLNTVLYHQTSVFVDPTCTQLAVSVDRGCMPAGYAYDLDQSQCGARFKIHAIVPETSLFIMSGGVCTPTSLPDGSFFQMTGTVTPDNFVAATVAVEP